MSPASQAALRLPVRNRSLSAAALVLTLGLAHAGSPAGREGSAVPELFAADEPLAFELSLDRRALCRPRPRRTCTATPALLTYRTVAGQTQRLDVRVRARGGWRDRHCDVPPLFIKLPAPPVSGPFAAQRLLPLTTHCRTSSARYEQYVLKEYLAYRLYDLFTNKSLRTRLARVTYRDPGRRGRDAVRYGFIVEHFDHLVARHRSTLTDPGALPLADADGAELATVELFQYLVGNTDWSIVAGHNVVRLRNARGALSAVPYDFDFAGLVGAPYASPPPQLRLRSVRERLFRGFCHPQLDWDRLFERFTARRGAALELIETLPGLEPAHRNDVREYVLDFFDVIASPDERQREIVAACRPLAAQKRSRRRLAGTGRSRRRRRFSAHAEACAPSRVEAYIEGAPGTAPPPAKAPGEGRSRSVRGRDCGDPLAASAGRPILTRLLHHTRARARSSMGDEAVTVRFSDAMRAGWIAMCLPVLCFAQAEPPDAAIELRAGSVTRAAQSASQHSEYVFDAAPGRTYLIELEQHGLDFVLSVEDPAFDARTYGSPLLRDEREIVLLEDTLPGLYRVSVRAHEHTGAAGQHVVRLSLLSPEEDVRLWAAMSAGAAAFQRGGEQGWTEAIASYEAAAELARDSGRRREAAQALFSIAMIEYWYRFAWTRAAEASAAAARLYAELAEPVLEASALHLRAAALIEEATNVPRTSSEGFAPRARALFDEALGLFDRARRTFEQHGKSYEVGLAINNIGLTHYYMGEYADANRLWAAAAALFRRLDEWNEESKAVGNQAVIAAEQGYLGDAIAAFERSLEILAADHPDRALTLDNLAASHYARGDFDDALRLFSEALELHRESDDRKGEAHALRGIGATYFALGHLELAAEFLERALPVARQSGDGRNEESIRGMLGNVAFLEGAHDAALEHHRAALALATAPTDAAAVQVLLAKDLVALGRHAEASVLATEANATGETAGAKLLVADALQQSGRARIGLGDTAAATSDLSRALAIYRELGVPTKASEALHGLAQSAAAEGRLDDAVRYGSASLDALEAERVRIAAPELRAHYAAIRRGLYDTQIELLMALHRAADGDTDARLRAAFETSERSRARVLLDLLHEAADEETDASSDRLLDERARLIERLAELRHRRDLWLGVAPATADAQANVAEAVAEMAVVDNELKVLETTLRARDARHAELAAANPLSLTETQVGLDADSTLVQYALGERRSYAWVVTSSAVHAAELAPRRTIESAARRAHDALARYSTDERGRQALDASLDALADAVLAPVRPYLDGRKRIVIAADGALQYVPFGVLRDADADGRRLLERYEIAAVPSASAVLASRTAARPTLAESRVAVIADPVFEPDDVRLSGDRTRRDAPEHDALAELRPRSALLAEPLARLPFAGREASAIAALVPPADRLVLTGVAANRDAVVSANLGAYRFVHFATHGFVDSRYPALSGLALSRLDEHGAQRDGFLRLDDIHALDLNADVVVLSACETALGREIRGEGLLGLTHAFMHAGARSTVASLWQVPDRATAELMSRFYAGMLEQGLRPAEALRAAQLEIASERRWRDPYFWGAFVLMGDWR